MSAQKDQAIDDTATALDILLHPLVVMNVGDHFTRSKDYTQHKRAVGILLGEQRGRKVEVHTSFECMFTVDSNGCVQMAKDFLNGKLDQFLQVFPSYEILGWYTTGKDLTDKDLVPHQFVMEFNESPLVLLIDYASTKSRDIPVYMFETNFHVGEAGKQNISFVPISYRMESEESERVCVDHITHLSAGGVDSKLLKQLNSYRVAITMLQERIKLIVTYLENVKSGKIPKDHNMLRKILSLCHKLPTMDSDKFTSAYTQEYQDALLITHLGTLTKGCRVLEDLIEKFNFTFEKRSRRGWGGNY